MLPASFSLRGGRLHGRREEAWSAHRETYCIDIPRLTSIDPSVGGEAVQALSVSPEYRLDISKVYGRNRADAPLIVEIGSGLGETIVQAGSMNPKNNYLAVEVFTPGLASTVLKLEQQKKAAEKKQKLSADSAAVNDNVRLAQIDARKFLATALPKQSVTELWIFFPDPWPKRRHHKRRLLNSDFLNLAARVLIPGGILRVASDWDHYALSIRELLDADPHFTNNHPGEHAGKTFRISGTKGRPGGAATREIPLEEDTTIIDCAGGWAPRFAERPFTSYEKKAKNAGRNIHELSYLLSSP